jgi:iron complex transport system ATP-binding protein
MSTLELSSLNVRFGSRRVVEGFDLKVNGGEIVALIGPNGAGKTTVLRAASGVIPLESGKVLVDGQDLARLSPGQRASILAVVPQAHNLPHAFSVWQIVLLGRTPYLGWMGQASPKDLERAQWALERVQLQELRERPIDELSGGEQQRALLARSLAQDTPVLLMDEPTTYLDLHHQSVLLNLVRELAHEHGLAVLMALHDLNLAALYADRVALLVSGRLQAVGSPGEVLTADLLSQAFEVPVHVTTHPDYGTPLVLPDGRSQKRKNI